MNNRTVVLVDARKILAKYNLLHSVRAKVGNIKKGVQRFKQALTPLFSMGLPSFWDSKNNESLYNVSMVQPREDHNKFTDMVKGLKGEVVVKKMKDDFQLPILFREIRSRLPIVTHDTLIELGVLQKEMMDAPIPNDAAWKEIQRVGKQVFLVPSST